MGKSRPKIQYRALGAVNRVTGSCHLVEFEDTKILIDYGMVQDSSMPDSMLHELNARELPVRMNEVDYIILTHAHLDHTGLVPLALARGFNGRILATEATLELASIVWTDTAHIMSRSNTLATLYIQSHVCAAEEHSQGYGFFQKIQLTENIQLHFRPAGHLLGAASVVLDIRRSKFEVTQLVFSGDTSGDADIPFIRGTCYTGLKPDYLITETTYGTRRIKRNIEAELQKLKDDILETVNNGGTVLIPVFAIGRSTLTLWLMMELFDDIEHRKWKIYLASPMANNAHQRYVGASDDMMDEDWLDILEELNAFDFRTVKKFEHLLPILSNKKGKIILASSGMLTGGYSQYIVEELIEDPKNMIVFMGYQGEGTLGRNILEHEEVIIKGTEKEVKAQVRQIKGFSGHGDVYEIARGYNAMDLSKCKMVIGTHGEHPEDFLKIIEDILQVRTESAIEGKIYYL